MNPVDIFGGRDFEADMEKERLQALQSRAPEALDPARLEDMMASVREEAWRRGHEEGLSEGQARASQDISASVASVLSGLSSRLGDLVRELDIHKARVEDDVANFFLSLLERAVPELLSGYGEDRIQAEVAAIARRAQGSRWLEIRVSPEVSESVRAALEAALPAGGGMEDVRVVPDGTMGPTDISASWQGGQSEHSHERLCRTLLETMRADIAARKERRNTTQ